MADIEKEDELIPVETPIEDNDTQAGAAGDDTQAGAADVDEDDDDDGGDARLATSDDDHDEAIVSANNARRKKRREMQKRAKEAQQRELAQLREAVTQLNQRLAQTESHTTASAVQALEQRLAQARAEVQQAEHIFARATEAGNGSDAAEALRIRDAARDEANRLAAVKQQFEMQTRQAAAPAAPQVDPRVQTYAQEWVKANPWYDPKGGDEDSAIAKQIDNELAREGYNPADITYWQELTNRVAAALDDGTSTPAAQPQNKRKGPPVAGNRGEHAPTSTRKEIYVTPERKQAMIDAGAWDDPEKRQRMLKAYQAYDQSSAR